MVLHDQIMPIIGVTEFINWKTVVCREGAKRCPTAKEGPSWQETGIISDEPRFKNPSANSIHCQTREPVHGVVLAPESG